MIIIYITSGCASCRKAAQWFHERRIPFLERNLVRNKLTPTEFKEILQLTDNGTEDIISKNSKQIKQLTIDIEQLPLKDLFLFIQEKSYIVTNPNHT